MTRLELVQEFCRLAGVTDTGGPATTIGQTGDYQKAVKYVDMAHEEIQNMYFDWDFLWGNSTIATSSGLANYAGAAELGIWDIQRIIYDYVPLPVYQWQDYVVEEIDNGEPQYAVLRPDNSLLIVPTPDATYTISYDYYKKPKVLAANADEPYIPSRFQRVIIGRALMLYGNFESAAEVKIQGQELYMTFLDQLEKHQLSRRQQTHGRSESMPLTVIAQ